MQNFPIQTFNGHCYALKTGLEHITYHVPITFAVKKDFSYSIERCMMKFWSSPITWISLKLSVISVMTFFKEITISIQHNGVQIISLTLPPSTAVLPSGSAGRQKGSTPTIPGGHLQLSPMHLSCGSTWFTDWGEKTSKTVPPQSHIYRLIVGFCSSLVSPD